MVESQQIFNTLMLQEKYFVLNLFLRIDGHASTNFAEVIFANAISKTIFGGNYYFSNADLFST